MAVPAGRGGAHRRHLRLHGAAAPRARGEAQGQRLPQRPRSTRSSTLRPDCVFGFSDLQADIAAELVRKGVQVTIFNQRSVEEIFAMLYQVAAHGRPGRRGLERLERHARRACWRSSRRPRRLPRRPRVFFEEWDEPHISAIRWVSRAGGHRRRRRLLPRTGACSRWARTASSPTAPRSCARNPDIVVGSWCGKKFRPEKVAARPGWEDVNAVRDGAAVRDQVGRHPAARTGGADRRRRAAASHRAGLESHPWLNCGWHAAN